MLSFSSICYLTVQFTKSTPPAHWLTRAKQNIAMTFVEVYEPTSTAFLPCKRAVDKLNLEWQSGPFTLWEKIMNQDYLMD
jgi:hypothetical protein